MGYQPYNWNMPEAKGLSEREVEILRLVATGASNKEIALRLVISPNTVKVHLRNIFEKLRVTSRTEATLYALRNGLVQGQQVAPIEPPSAEPLPVIEDDFSATALPVNKGRRGQAWLVAIFVVVSLLAALGFSLLRGGGVPDPTLTVNRVTPSAEVRWLRRADLPEARSDMAAAVYAGDLYLLGGVIDSGELAVSGLRWNPSKDAWQILKPKPTLVREAQAALLGEKLYMPGGLDASSQPTRQLEVYDPRTDRWETRAPLPEALAGYALTAFEGHLYLFGGWNGTQLQDAVLRYDPDADQWMRVGQMPLALEYGSAVVVNGSIHLLGGWDGTRTLIDHTVFFPQRALQDEAAWQKAATLPEARAHLGAVVLADLIYVVGGEDVSDSSPVARQYLPKADQWLLLSSSPVNPPTGAALLALDNHLHLLGGKGSAHHWDYQAIYTILFPVVK